MATDLFKAYSPAKARPKRGLSIIPAATYVQPSGNTTPGKQMFMSSIIGALANKPKSKMSSATSPVPKVKLS